MHSIRFRCKSFALFRLFERSFYSKNFCNLSTREMTDIKRKVEEDFDNEHSNVHFKRSRLIKKLKVELGDCKWYIENGLRKVYPYEFTYHTFCKGRWLGKKIKEMYQTEFKSITDNSFNKRIENGFLKVNGVKAGIDHVLKENDFISSRVHRHEFPVLATPIPIIHLDDNLLVIDKPPSLPVHPCGKYRYNTIVSLLEKEHNLKNLHILHRLDRLASGVMLIARTKSTAQKFHEQMRNRDTKKEYVCRVEGKFPDGVIECNEPIETLSHRLGICIVSPKGKESKTVFERMNFNGKSSTVKCKPLTGRMHQIRVHLQFLGHPILNDNFYNSSAFGPNKGKNADFGKSLEQLITDIENDHERDRYILDSNGIASCQNQFVNEEEKNQIALKALHHYTSNESWNEIKKNYIFKPEEMIVEDNCEECQIKTIDPSPREQLIYLHALRYYGEDWSFESQLPIWASETWTYD